MHTLHVYVGPAPQMNQDCVVKVLHCLDKLLVAAIRRYMINKKKDRGREVRISCLSWLNTKLKNCILSLHPVQSSQKMLHKRLRASRLA